MHIRCDNLETRVVLVDYSFNIYGSMRSNLVKTMSITNCAILILFVQLANSVIMPPRLFIPIHYEQPSTDYQSLNSDIPYQITINEGSSKSVPLNSRSGISVNLNRAVPENISVLLTVFSGPNLISFDKNPPKAQASNLSDYPDAQLIQFVNNSTTSYKIEFPANTFGDRIVLFHTGDSAGHAEIVCKVVNQPKDNITIDDSQAYISLDIYRVLALNIVIQIVGWIYFFAWSISFYFQCILNYQRKSVIGLNFDFLALNLLGFTCYSMYNITLLFSYDVQQEYYKRYTYSRIPIEYNDLFFALHAVAITLVTVVQCCIYERGEQKVSVPSIIFLGLSSIIGIGLFIASIITSLSILDVVFYLSYVKLVITTVKYAPQAYMNHRRKATTGWSIHNIILDFTGGSFSFIQMLLIAYNYNDWISIFGNFAKFGLGVISMIFDVLFLIQHYVLYSHGQHLVSGDLDNSSESVPSPVISQSIRSANASQQQHQQDDSDLERDE